MPARSLNLTQTHWTPSRLGSDLALHGQLFGKKYARRIRVQFHYVPEYHLT